MPPKADPRDWNRYFRPDAPRRGGPLHALLNVVIVCIALGILVGAGVFAWQYGLDRARENASQIATAEVQRIETRTAEAVALQATQTVVAMPTPVTTPTAEPEPTIGRASVTNGGNLRSETVVTDATVIGQVCVDDQVDLLEERTLDNGARWYRLRVTTTTPERCTPNRVAVGTEGWINATLLKLITP